MINKEKVALMTSMAAFEKHEGKKNLNIINYYRSDYIGFQVLKSVIAATLCFIFVGAVYLFYNFEELMANIYIMDLMELGKNILIIYCVFIAVYAIITYVVSMYRYAVSKRRLKTYYGNLRVLENMSNR